MHPHELTPRQLEAAEAPDELPGLADAEFTALGRRARRVEGLRKSTGREIYTDDIVLPGMLHGKILRSWGSMYGCRRLAADRRTGSIMKVYSRL